MKNINQGYAFKEKNESGFGLDIPEGFHGKGFWQILRAELWGASQANDRGGTERNEGTAGKYIHRLFLVGFLGQGKDLCSALLTKAQTQNDLGKLFKQAG